MPSVAVVPAAVATTLPYRARQLSGFGSPTPPPRSGPRGITHSAVSSSRVQSMLRPTIWPWPLSVHNTRVHTLASVGTARRPGIPSPPIR